MTDGILNMKYTTDDYIDMLLGIIPEDYPEPKESEHGKVLSFELDTYGDRIAYEDGYVEFYDRGD